MTAHGVAVMAAGALLAATATVLLVVRSDAPSRAERACRRTVAGQGALVAAHETTVGHVRAWRSGPGPSPASGRWAGSPDDTEAAWCWVDLASGRRRVYAVGPDDEPVLFVEANSGLAPNEAGPLP